MVFLNDLVFSSRLPLIISDFFPLLSWKYLIFRTQLLWILAKKPTEIQMREGEAFSVQDKRLKMSIAFMESAMHL